MKHRIRLTIDPAVARRAKKLARSKKTSASSLVEQFLHSTPIGQATGTSLDLRTVGGKV